MSDILYTYSADFVRPITEVDVVLSAGSNVNVILSKTDGVLYLNLAQDTSTLVIPKDDVALLIRALGDMRDSGVVV